MGGRTKPQVPAVVVSPARDLSLPDHVRAGQALARAADASGKRVALIASADHGHAHDAEGPTASIPPPPSTTTSSFASSRRTVSTASWGSTRPSWTPQGGQLVAVRDAPRSTGNGVDGRPFSLTKHQPISGCFAPPMHLIKDRGYPGRNQPGNAIQWRIAAAYVHPGADCARRNLDRLVIQRGHHAPAASSPVDRSPLTSLHRSSSGQGPQSSGRREPVANVSPRVKPFTRVPTKQTPDVQILAASAKPAPKVKPAKAPALEVVPQTGRSYAETPTPPLDLAISDAQVVAVRRRARASRGRRTPRADAGRVRARRADDLVAAERRQPRRAPGHPDRPRVLDDVPGLPAGGRRVEPGADLDRIAHHGGDRTEASLRRMAARSSSTTGRSSPPPCGRSAPTGSARTSTTASTSSWRRLQQGRHRPASRLDGRAYSIVNADNPDVDGRGLIGWYYPDEWDAFLQGSVTRQQLDKSIPAPHPAASASSR